MRYLLCFKPDPIQLTNDYIQLSFHDLDSNWPTVPDLISLLRQEYVVSELCRVFPEFGTNVSFLKKPRSVELHEINIGITISLQSDSAILRITPWYFGGKTDQDFEALEIVINIICTGMRFTCYDPQCQRNVMLPHDQPEIRRMINSLPSTPDTACLQMTQA
jgi:hypothetical protein